MRTRIGVAISDATPELLAAVASVLAAIGAGRWDHLARSFTRMEASRAEIAAPMAAIPEGLGQQLREAARERAGPLCARKRRPGPA
jgi:hypothetical protein